MTCLSRVASFLQGQKKKTERKEKEEEEEEDGNNGNSDKCYFLGLQNRCRL